MNRLFFAKTQSLGNSHATSSQLVYFKEDEYTNTQPFGAALNFQLHHQSDISNFAISIVVFLAVIPPLFKVSRRQLFCSSHLNLDKHIRRSKTSFCRSSNWLIVIVNPLTPYLIHCPKVPFDIFQPDCTCEQF
mmetsp:Transcript_26339/g.52921  ORF Transcript_26339/g.52921 Transcript_26339/m.52921 type:complete len:133 (+) Transcript_26339:106-504(+)